MGKNNVEYDQQNDIMCGICGIYGFNELPDAKRRIRLMNKKLSHRGPDHEGFYSEDKIVFGHRRLAIIDLADRSNQPMRAMGRYTIVYNGEVYNFRELKRELTDYRFRCETDTEVVLAAYIHWGADCLQQLNGMFAFAIWDAEKEELFLARDRVGIKPLYWCKEGNALLFASEIRALMAGRAGSNLLDKDALPDYCRYQTVHAPQTIIKDVYCLMPGHYMLQNRSGNRIQPYWKPEYSGKITESYMKVCLNLKKHLFRSVEQRLVSDVPFGAFLSGGIDSSAIVGIMSHLMDQKVSTFSVNFSENKYDESPYSDQIAKRFHTDHHRIVLHAEHCLELLPEALSSMDHPGGDGPNTWLISRATREEGITMALSGLGGDELFAGYALFNALKRLNFFKVFYKTPGWLRKAIVHSLSFCQRNVRTAKIRDLLSKDVINLPEAYSLARQVLLDAEIKILLPDEELPPNQTASIFHDILHEQQDWPYVSLISLAEMKTYLPNVLLRDTDQMSMASALEVRVPFLDHELIEYVLHIPDQMKLNAGPKKLLTDALENMLPQEIVNRPKMGFTFPWEHWMKKELNAFCKKRMQALAAYGFFNPDYLMSMWKSFSEGDPLVSWSRIWPLVVLSHWIEENHVAAKT